LIEGPICGELQCRNPASGGYVHPYVEATVAVGTEPFGVSLDAGGNTAYVANSGDDTVSVINTATNSVVCTVAG
jgi:YVTN family beta-propeller protein